MDPTAAANTSMMDDQALHSRPSSTADEPIALSLLHGLFDLTAAKSFSEEELADLREAFLRKGYVKLPGFLTSAARSLLEGELHRLKDRASRRAFEMPGYQSPRTLSVLGGRVISEHSPMLYGLYHHPSLRNVVASIAGRPIYSCQHAEEYMVANLLHSSGDTHGWHLDDPAFALVLFVKSPAEGEGGELELIPGWRDTCRRKGRTPDEDINDLIEWARDNGLIEQHGHNAGDAYLLRADINLHRVKPITAEGVSRHVINLAFQANANTQFSETATMLYAAQS